MRGKKIIGALESAAGLKRAIEKRNSNDELHVVAFNHAAKKLKDGILNVETGGATDIALALKRAREIVERKNGAGVIFLITDGVPTSSYNKYLNPWVCTLQEAEKLKKINARLQIILFEKGAKFLELCEKIAKRCGKASIIHIPDPLDLKRYIVRNYLRRF